MDVRRAGPRCAAVGCATAVLLLGVLAAPASAHGVGGSAAYLGIGGFFSLGITPMLAGWDHLLFVAGLLLVAAHPRRAAQLVSVFAAGHSLTLVLATLAAWRVDPYLVDVAIVVSLVFVGGRALIGRPRRWWAFGLAVFGFGLLHGLGLSARFQALGVNPDGQIWKLLAFNAGIEVGQVTAIVGMLSVLAVVAMCIGKARAAFLGKPLAVLLFAVGAIGAPLMVVLQGQV